MYFYCLSHIQTSLTLTEDRPTEKQTGAGHYRCKLPPCIPLCYQSRESWGALGGKQGWATRGLPLSNPSKHQREAPVMWDSWKLLKIIQVFRNGAQVPLYRDLPTTPLISTTALKRAFHSITFRQTRGTRTRQVHLNEAQCSLLTKNNKKKTNNKATHTHTHFRGSHQQFPVTEGENLTYGPSELSPGLLVFIFFINGLNNGRESTFIKPESMPSS